MAPTSLVVTPRLRALTRRATRYLASWQFRLEQGYRLLDHDGYSWSQETGVITFFDAGVPLLTADFEFVGSVSTVKGCWLWSWANASMRESTSQRVLVLRTLGARQEIPQLTHPCWAAEESDAWEMTAIASWFLRSQGALQHPTDQGSTFLLLNNIRYAN